MAPSAARRGAIAARAEASGGHRHVATGGGRVAALGELLGLERALVLRCELHLIIQSLYTNVYLMICALSCRHTIALRMMSSTVSAAPVLSAFGPTACHETHCWLCVHEAWRRLSR